MTTFLHDYLSVIDTVLVIVLGLLHVKNASAIEAGAPALITDTLTALPGIIADVHAMGFGAGASAQATATKTAVAVTAPTTSTTMTPPASVAHVAGV